MGDRWSGLAEAWRNEISRRTWLENYSKWEVWAKTPELGLTWYKFELPNEKRIVVCEYSLFSAYTPENFQGRTPKNWCMYLLGKREQLCPIRGVGVTDLLDELRACSKIIK